MSKPLLFTDRAVRQAARSATQGPRASHRGAGGSGDSGAEPWAGLRPEQALGRICFFAGCKVDSFHQAGASPHPFSLFS